MSELFRPWKHRGVELRNRIAASPILQYAATGGMPSDWHLLHLGGRAAGGVGLVMTGQTAVSEQGPMSEADLGLWSEDHVEPFARLSRYVREQHTAFGIQLGHAGRKGGSGVPFGDHAPRDVPLLGPSPLAFGDRNVPRALPEDEIKGIIQDFANAGRRAVVAEADWIEVHAGHGFLLHTFLSTSTNLRDDGWGGRFEHRVRLLRRIVVALRKGAGPGVVLSVKMPVDDLDGGWSITDAIQLSRTLAGDGVDVITAAHGGLVAGHTIDLERQRALTLELARSCPIPVAAVSGINTAQEAEASIDAGIGLVFLSKPLLRDPNWPIRAARELGAPSPLTYARERVVH